MPFTTTKPVGQFTDINGKPLDGQVFFGQPNLDPIANPITVYWDAAGTQPVTQPVVTVGGYPMNGNTRSNVFVNADYSILVRNRNGFTVFSAPNLPFEDSSDNQYFLQAGSGAVTRTAQSKMREVVSVFDFMTAAQIADVQAGTASIDVTAAIQAASLAVATAGGGTVYFPTGTYVANNLSIRTGVLFKGSETSATKIRNTSSVNHAFVSLVDVDNWGFEDLTIQNTNALCLDGIRVIPATGTSRRWHLTNVRIEGGDNALNLVNCYLGVVNGLDILIGFGGRLNTGIHLGDSTNPTIANVWNEVWVTAAATYGIHIEKGSTNTFNNPVVQSCTGGGIYADDSNSNVFVNPYFEANTGAFDIKTDGQSDVIIGSYHAGTVSKPTNTIVLNGNDCEAYAPNLPNAITPNLLIGSSAQRCKIFGGWYQNGFINQVTDTGAGSIYYGNTARRRVQALGVSGGVGSVSDADFYTYGGNADITSINATWAGHEIMILFSGNAATNGVVDGGNLRLAGNFAYTSNDTIKLYCDGTNWYEISRSVN